MLAKESNAPFSNKDWLFEIKWDGYRAIAEVNKANVRLYSRNGNSFNNNYPSIVEALGSMNIKAVLDGEVVVINEEGKPDFQKLQHYDSYRYLPLVYYVFDLLELNGKKLYSKPLIERKALLQNLLKDDDAVKYSDHIEESGEDFFEAIKQKNLEGVMAKKKESEYYPGKRTGEWLKIKHQKTTEAVITGFTAPRGGRKYFGALVLGSFINGTLTYIGHTGSGFDTALLKDIYTLLEATIISLSPFSERVKTNMPVTWVEPRYVCELQFTEWTIDNKLRHPIFLRMRDDKTINDLKEEQTQIEPHAASADVDAGSSANVADIANETETTKQRKSREKKPLQKKSVEELTLTEKVSKKVSAKSKDKPALQDDNIESVVKNEKEKIYKISKAELKTTNRTKIFFPEDGITKGDVIDYYEQMADVILPYLKDRPESLFRTPNGINQKGFFQKDAADDAPSWVKHIELYSDSTKKDIDYILCNDKLTLLYLANLGCIEINPWHSTTKSLDNPDYLIIDIDPSDNNTFQQVVQAANVVKTILDKAGAFSICKTSGASGLHIYVPLGKQYDYEQAKDFAYLVCMMANELIPEFTTLERSLSKRSKDHIYMDYLQNRRGQTIACVYSLRPKKGVTVSTPLEWDEVTEDLNPRDFNIHTIHDRLKTKGDLFAKMLDKSKAADLEKCLENLSV